MPADVTSNLSTDLPHGAVWDCHVHCYPASVSADPAAFARQHNEPHWLDLVSNGPQGWADAEQLLRSMDRDGVEKVLLQAWYWENPETCRLQNDWHAEWVGRYPDRLMAFAAIHPDFPDPIAELQRARDWGACGIGECLPQIQCEQGWHHPGWQAVLEWATAMEWPVGVHVTEPVGHRYPGRVETPLMELVELIEHHPQQKWMFAHWGGGLPFHALNRRVRKALKHVWFDTAAGPLLYSPRVWHIACELVGTEKILFGSDFPLILYPRKDDQPGWHHLLHELRHSGLSPVAVDAVSSGNLKSLLGTA